MAEYQETATDQVVIRTADQVHIPNDDANRDWRTYQDWLADGGVPDPYVPPVIAPGTTPPVLMASGHADIASGAITLGPNAFNIASATYVSVGVFQFTFMTLMSDKNYAAMITCAAPAELSDRTTRNFTINVVSGVDQTPHDPRSVSFQIFRVPVT
jgi:hypothetical protein